MGWRTSRFCLALRSVGRRLGLTGMLVRVLARDYEERFSAAMLKSIEPGEVVWDVGANVGFYTTRFADRVRGGGRVVAIEPNPNACRRLQGRIDGLDNVAIVKAALADEQKTMILALRGRRSQLVSEEGGRCTRVAVFTADGLIAAGRAPFASRPEGRCRGI